MTQQYRGPVCRECGTRVVPDFPVCETCGTVNESANRRYGITAGITRANWRDRLDDTGQDIYSMLTIADLIKSNGRTNRDSARYVAMIVAVVAVGISMIIILFWLPGDMVIYPVAPLP